MTEPSPGNGEQGSGRRANLAAVIAVAILIALGYWAFTAIDRSRRLQQCLDSGRHNCAETVDQGR